MPDPIATPVWPLESNVSWTAQWIAPASTQDLKNCNFRARARFTLNTVPTSCVLCISAESLYRLFVNGVEVGEGPIRGTVTRNFVDGWQIAALLRTGDNWVAVQVHNNNIPSFKYAPYRPALLAQSDDGTICTDASWQVQIAADWRVDVPIYTLQQGFMEWRDMRLEPQGWQVGQDTSAWQSAQVVAPALELGGKQLLARDIPALRTSFYPPVRFPIAAMVPPLPDAEDTAVAERISAEPHSALPDADALREALTRLADQPVTIHPPVDGSGVALIIDFAHELTRGVEIEVDGSSGTIVDVAYEEEVRDGRLRVDVSGYKFADRYILRDRRQSIGRWLMERGCRMVQLVLRNMTGPVTLLSATGIDRRYPTDSPARFVCSDAALNTLWTMCQETLSACATDTFIDCPWRESALWMNDVIVENQTWLKAFGDARLNARCLRLGLSQVREDGLIAGVCPYDGNAHHVLVATNMFYPLFLEDYWLHTGDRSLVEELLEPGMALMKPFEAWEDTDGLVLPPKQYWNFIDWGYGLTNVDLNGKMSSAFNWIRVLALDAAARLLDRLGRNGEAEPLRAKAAAIAQAIDRRFWVAQTQRYAEWEQDGQLSELSSQLTHTLAWLSGRLPADRAQQVAQRLDDDACLKPELYLSHLLFQAMVGTNQAEHAMARIRRYWLPMVEAGSPTIWEAGVHMVGKPAFNDAGSLCHGFATTPISFLQTQVLGVQPIEPGFAVFSLAPHAHGLQHASGTVPTPHGAIEVAWTVSGEGFDVQITVPEGTQARLADGSALGAGFHCVRM